MHRAVGTCIRRLTRPRRCPVIMHQANAIRQSSESSWSIDDILLVAGTTVGAGALALPAVTSEAGFAVSSVVLVLAALFSISTGLLIAEVVINTLRDKQEGQEGGGSLSLSSSLSSGAGGSSSTSDSNDKVSLSLTSISVSLLKLDERTKLLIVLPYLLLHYACLCAYSVKGSEVLQAWTSLDGPYALGAFSLPLGAACFFLPSKTMDRLNSFLVVLLSASFVGLVAVTSEGFEIDLLSSRFNPPAITSALPIILLSFVYHNVIPFLITKNDNPFQNSESLKRSIIVGVSIPLVMFLLWEASVLGAGGIAIDSLPGSDPLTWLRQSSSSSGFFINAFTLLAVSTSYIAFIFSLSGFIQDAFEIEGVNGGNKARVYLLTLAPPTIWALIDPDSFITALDLGGTYGVLFLFGILPPLLSYAQRYSKDAVGKDRVELLGGGKLPLFIIGGISLAIIGHSLTDSLGLI